MGGISNLFVTSTPTPRAVPLSDGSGTLKSWVSSGSGGGLGDVVGPASSTDSTLAIFDGISGKKIKDLTGSGVVIQNGSGASFFPFSATPLPFTIPISDGSSKLDLWVTPSSGSGSANIQTLLDSITSVQGSILFRGASAWLGLPPGDYGQPLLSGGSGGIPFWEPAPSALYLDWVAAVDAAGGTYLGDTKAIANDLANALLATTYFSKLVWVLPMLGGNLATARVPLLDTLSAGIVTSAGFVEGDFSQATGIQGNGSTKFFDTLIKASQLGAAASNNGGVGFWIRTFNTGTWCMGSRAANLFGVAIYSDELMYWGDGTTFFDTGAAGSSGDYYGQRASDTDRKLFKNGSQIASSTASGGSVAGIGTNNIICLGVDGAFLADHQFSVFYMTDGTLTGAEVLDLHNLLQTHLIGPTGR